MKENYIVVCRKHWSVFLWRGLLSLLVIFVGLPTIGWFTFVVLAVIVIPGVITYKTDYIALTDTKIVGKRGFIRSKEMSSPISKVQNISLTNGLMGKILGYHTVVVDNAGSGASEFVFTNMAHAQAFVDTVHSRMK